MNPFFLQARQHSLTSPPSLLHVRREFTSSEEEIHFMRGKNSLHERKKETHDSGCGTSRWKRDETSFTSFDDQEGSEIPIQDANVKHEWDEHTNNTGEKERVERERESGVSLLENERKQRAAAAPTVTGSHFLNGLLGDPLPYLPLCFFSLPSNISSLLSLSL